MDWSIICPSGDPRNLESAFRSVIRAHPGVELRRLIAVIGFDPAELPPELRGITWLKQRKPFVYAQAVNDALAVAPRGNLVLLNDDVTVTSPDTFNVLHRRAEETGGSVLLHPAVDGNTMRHEFMSAPPEADVRDDYEEFPFICPFIPRRLLEAVGPLDEAFAGYGKEDYDYCIRARRLGFRLSIVPRVRVNHHVEKSVYRRRSDLGQLLKDNHRVLKEKWGINSP